MSSWVYFLGEAKGQTIKIGWCENLAKRLKGVNQDQQSDDRFVLLAAVPGGPTAESAVQKHFADLRIKTRGSRTEYFTAAPELVEYVNWLRRQWYVVSGLDEDAPPEQHHNDWAPDPERRVPFGKDLPTRAFGPLGDTAWSWLPDPKASFQDYFTPDDLVRRAAEAMGGIDLDAASHWLAHKKFAKAGIHIADYYDVTRDALSNDWIGRVWLNPPYGDNAPWLHQAAVMLDRGLMTQLCWLSPVYAFGTSIAQPLMARSAGMVLLSPTPQFENPSDATRTGTNLPHAIFYWGDRFDAFVQAFEGVGLPFELRL